MNILTLRASAAVNLLCETLAFAPKSDLARVLITKALMKMCYTEEDAFWLVERAANLHTSWDTCGIPGLRQILSSRCTPKDGVVFTSTEAYPEGIPLEHQVPKPDPLHLLSGQSSRVGSEPECPGLRTETKDLPDAVTLQAPETAVNPKLKPFTQGDIDRAMSDFAKRKRAKDRHA
jgi:hypothetical protein